MGFEPPVVVYDACVLYPFHTRNLLVQCAADGLVRARWTNAIHDEWIRNVAAAAPSVSAAGLLKVRDLMNRVIPDAHMEDAWPAEVPTLPDPGDRHVVAAAMRAGASRIVTWNLRHFPDAVLGGAGLRAETPDALLMGLFGDAGEAVIASVRRARLNLRRTTPSPSEFLEAMERQGLRRFVAVLRRHEGEL